MTEIQNQLSHDHLAIVMIYNRNLQDQDQDQNLEHVVEVGKVTLKEKTVMIWKMYSNA